MIETILFVFVGISGMYFLYKIMRKEVVEGKCSSCTDSKSCKSKKCN